jgi:hypothetical protein
MRPVAHRAKPARTAYADRHGPAIAGDLDAFGVDQVRRTAHQRRAAGVSPHRDDGSFADHAAPPHPRHGSTLGKDRR